MLYQFDEKKDKRNSPRATMSLRYLGCVGLSDREELYLALFTHVTLYLSTRAHCASMYVPFNR